MEDLRESGDIEQDADTVLLLHKYDYYDPEAVDKAGVSCNGRGRISIICWELRITKSYETYIPV